MYGAVKRLFVPALAVCAALAGLVIVMNSPCAVTVETPVTMATPMKGNTEMSMRYGIDITGKVNAPSFDGAVGWLNVERPITLAHLRGKVVLLDFWTYCCINCMHVISDLKKLEKKYGGQLAVIGVHSAKFANEKETSNIREAVLRYEIRQPVANDADFAIWTRYAATGWPYLVVIDPDGKIVGTLSGEGNYGILDDVIAALVKKFEGRLNTKPLPLSLEKDKVPDTFLSFPGKVLADEAGGRLFIADSNHNRIVIADFDGNVLAVAGNGGIGAADGPFAGAGFNHPQGMALDGESLFVADTENHLLRRLDLAAKTVETVAGTGQQSLGGPGGPALSTPLNSPWDVTILAPQRPGTVPDGDIYIAMAGPHQIWVYRGGSKTVEPFAGSGREGILDAALSAAALAQPSGITNDGANLYFADSEASALREIVMLVLRSEAPLRPVASGVPQGVDAHGAPHVKTLIGKGLFEFGDTDGASSDARLQHPLGVAYHDGVVYVADTYNHKIKAADLAARTIRTIAGTGRPGLGTPDAPQFYEPGGLDFARSRLYVADTDNSAIRVVDPATGVTETLEIAEPPSQSPSPIAFDVFPTPGMIELGGKPIPAQGTVEITFEFAEGYHFNGLAAPIVQLKVTGAGGATWVSEKSAPHVDGDVLSFPVSTGGIESPVKIEAAITFYYCRTDAEGQCLIGSALLEGPAAAAPDLLALHYTVASK